jgi:hypothetical protein
MLIIGCDFHTRYQQIAMAREGTAELLLDIHRNHSPALITVQPSFSTIPCKTLNNLIPACYTSSVFIESYPRPPGSRSNYFKIFPSQAFTFSPTLRPHKSFRCNTYRSPRKCCKQKTYGLPKPFRCNTYRKHGVGHPQLSPRYPLISYSPYTLPSSVSCKCFICHSYENTGGVGVFFPFWDLPTRRPFVQTFPYPNFHPLLGAPPFASPRRSARIRVETL